ncbi:sigma-70 family RNA polymerase sigma factor [Azotobacter chroococcum]|uniref:sigma-70 family RNA polymerase sigma factor n=1 Tax=Azotobacter chroococcum TaxID=353 RepID=UPI001A954D82|nr:sigma-70 family RNA polymerase sigma factor [Azotobacter chroococcum]
MNTLSPLLRMATIAGVEIAVKHHIRRGDDLDARDGKGATPLMLAAGRKKVGIVRLLLAAGANPALLDPEGRAALAYAEKAGCDGCAALLREALTALRPAAVEDAVEQPPSVETTFLPSLAESLAEASPEAFADISFDKREPVVEKIESVEQSVVPTVYPVPRPQEPERVEEAAVEIAERPPHVAAGTPARLSESLSVPDLDDADLDDLDDWEAEPEVVAPRGDDRVVEEARVLHEAIGRHQAIDGDEDWDDIDLFLPDRALPLIRDDGEAGGVRGLLFRALREGSVPESALIDACLKTDESRNQEAESLLTFVIGDLGAVIDGVPEIDEPPFLGEPTAEENLEIAEAFEFAEDLASGWNDPLRIYLNLKEFRGDLLEAEEEIALSREMEECGTEALDALSRWPEGFAAVFDAAERIARGEADVEAFSSGAEPSEESEASLLDTSLDEVDEVELDRDAAAFVSAISHARSLDRDDVAHIRAALATAGLSRGFMLELAAKAGDDPAGILFASAVRRQAAARERMICSNLRLAYSVAKKYQWSTEALDDLVQEANIGLMKAVERFDWRRGFRFSTYAMWWIRQQVARAIADKARMVRVPVHMYEAASKIRREREAFEAREGRPESKDEISLRTGIPLAKVGHLLSTLEDIVSLEEPDPEVGLPRGDLLIDATSPDPAAVMEAESLRRTLAGMVGELDERAAKVISLRFGLRGEDAMTLEEVGLRFDVTRERIRQIESKALGKLSRRMMGDVESFMDGVSAQKTMATSSPAPQVLPAASLER